jgi:leader peptidase (prepilin peptidase)/N-methyltransferase
MITLAPFVLADVILGPGRGYMDVMFGEEGRLALTAFMFFFGAIMGSFFNVVIYRMPLDQSVVHPGSHCASCGSPIPWYFNIPVVSWWWLRGRAACCHTRIDARYWVIELLTGILYAGLYMRYGENFGQCLAYIVLLSFLIVASGIDLDHYYIPDTLLYMPIILGILASTLMPYLQGVEGTWNGLGAAVWSAGVSAVGLYLVAWVGTKVFKKEAMGSGDFYLLAGMAAFLGWKASIFIVIASSFMGSFVGVAIIAAKRGNWGTHIPYGPYLALGAVAWLFGGDELTAWYIDRFLSAAFAPMPHPEYLDY